MVGFLMRKVFNKNLTSELTEIKITENGFSLHKPFGAKPKVFNWKMIKDIYFSENNTEVIIQDSGKQLILKNTFTGWYELIQNVPHNFVNFDFNYVLLFMNALQPCDVCGLIAVKENECLVCGKTTWNNKMPESKMQYIKQMQLDLFSALIKEGRKIKNHVEPEHGFKADKNWKLL